jgi:hypothetical protein
MDEIRGIIMLSYHVEASRGNKKFIMSVLDALNELRADDFVQLYLKAQDPTAYKLDRDDSDPYAKLLCEIAEHETLINIKKDHGDIILRAMYAAPSISNPAKAVGMLMIGATLEYEDFVSRFGKGGDLEPKAFEQHEMGDFAKLYSAFRAGAQQSEDVRFIIDKASISSEVCKKAIENGSPRIPSLFVGGYKFTVDTFSQFLDSSLDEHKADLLTYAPKGFYESDYFIGLLESNITLDSDTLYEILPGLYQAGRVEAFKSLLPKFFAHADHHNIVRSPPLNKILSVGYEAGITAEQIAIKSIYKEAFNNFTSSVISVVGKTKPGVAYNFVKDILRNSFKANDLDHFARVLKEATQSHPVGEGRDHFEDLYVDLAGYMSGLMRSEGATANMKAMLVFLKDTAVNRMNEAVDLVNNLPEVPFEEHQRNKKYDGMERALEASGGIPQIIRAASDEFGL